MKNLPFIIASTPRSGTGYIWQLLSALDIGCHHERYFNRYRQVYQSDDGYGESSWMAVPFLANLPKDTVILHQTRNPLRTINSLRLTHAYNEVGRDMNFLRSHFKANGPQPEAEFWLRWHEHIERYEHFRFQAENIPLERILELLGIDRSKDQIRTALTAVPRTFNTSGDVPQDLSWDDLPATIRNKALEYGYELN